MIGDRQDFLARIKAALPRGWFGDNHPIIDAILGGFATAWANCYSLYTYVQQQARIATASGAWLDVIASDFFGAGLPRLANELDPQYRARIRAALFVEQGTRNAIYYTLLRLTGQAPIIFEPARPADTGAYMASGGQPMGLAYGIAGGYGSLNMAYQALVQIVLPQTASIPLIAGYGVSTGAYSTPSQIEYAQLSSMQNNVVLSAIYSAVDAAKPAGTIVWVGTLNNPPTTPGVIGVDFAIGNSAIY